MELDIKLPINWCRILAINSSAGITAPARGISIVGLLATRDEPARYD